jgi:6-pyruvoyltetrahydropterin/6-carboxytetrahydropterin synthase
MYEISAAQEFSAAHQHPGYDGKCRQLHGHNYRVVAYVQAETLDELGFVCDFIDISKALKAIIEEFDHTMINDHPDFVGRQPSAENIAEYFFRRLRPSLDKGNHWIDRVEIWETDRYCARYMRKR